MFYFIFKCLETYERSVNKIEILINLNYLIHVFKDI